MLSKRIQEYWRFLKSLFKTNIRLIRGMWQLTKLPQPTITFFGGARVQLDSEIARKAADLAKMLATNGFSILTGGGPGIMEAANMGAFNSVKDCNIEGASCTYRQVSAGIGLVRLNKEKANPFVQNNIVMEHFFSRKWLLVRYSIGFVIFPGGYGTLDELFETLTLIQCNRMAKVPVILIDRTFWQPIMQWLETQALAHNLLTPEEAKLITVTDNIDEAFKIINYRCKNKTDTILQDETSVKL